MSGTSQQDAAGPNAATYASASVVDAQFSRLGAVGAQLGESPVWAPRAECVWWVDIDGRQVHETRLDGETRSWPTPEPPGFVQLDASEIPVIGMQSGLFRFDPAERRFERIARQPIASQRFNDSCVDSHGGLWGGTMDLENSRADGVLYRIMPDGAAARVLDGFRTINGLAWDCATDRLYVSDSHPDVQAVWTLDCPDGVPQPETRRLFARFDALAGRPDGAAIDAERGYWIAGVGGGELYRFTPDGLLAARVRVPMVNPTKPAFTGAQLDQMALTAKGGDDDDGGLRLWPAVGVTGAANSMWPRGAQPGSQDDHGRSETVNYARQARQEGAPSEGARKEET